MRDSMDSPDGQNGKSTEGIGGPLAKTADNQAGGDAALRELTEWHVEVGKPAEEILESLSNLPGEIVRHAAEVGSLLVGMDMAGGPDVSIETVFHRQDGQLRIVSQSERFKPVHRLYYSILENELVLYAEKNVDMLPAPCTDFGRTAQGFHRRQRERSANHIPIDEPLRTLLVKADERAKDKTNGLRKAEISRILDFVEAQSGIAPMLPGEAEDGPETGYL